MHDSVVILDFGSQYTQLIARRVREMNVFSKIINCRTPHEKILAEKPKGIILSGGPSSVYEGEAPKCDEKIFTLGIPVLGICYGMQLGCEAFGGKVLPASKREYGRRVCHIDNNCELFSGLEDEIVVWMSHGDQISDTADKFQKLAHTDTAPFAAFKHREQPFYGVQFHPEVTHTPMGRKILRNFLYNVCGCTGDWRMEDFIESSCAAIKKQVGNERVVLGLSGGVDSSVAAALISKAIGEQLVCIFVDNGVLRKGEAKFVIDTFKKHFKLNFQFVDASQQFLSQLKGVTDPEKKRKIIGRVFIEVFEEKAREFKDAKFLAQGTLYPDVIESSSPLGGPSVTIKSHHNVGGLPEKLGFKLLEPLRDLFKDEVRVIGEKMGLPDEIVWRQPFPGPGLAVRILGEVNEERVIVLQNADAVVDEEIRAAGLYREIWQSFAVLLPVQSVGVMGDGRTYENAIAVRAVHSLDGMTADWVHLPYEVLARISTRIINEVKGINRVCYDISSKPPSTIEWE